MRTRVLFHFLFCLFLLSVFVPGSSILSGQGGHTIQFPLPPDPDGIGTHVGAINTHVDNVTLSPPASIHRLGLVFSEIRGLIRGVGWGGFDGAGAFHACHYTYELSYVLRIPPDWNGGLVIYRGQAESLETWEFYEATGGENSFARVAHEAADRYASDIALHPDRRWAFFAVNENPVAPGGLHNTLLVNEPGCVGGTPTTSGRDIPIARDHALLAHRLLKILRDRDVTMTLGVGFSAGGQEYFLLNAGFENFNRGGVTPLPVGDNHRTPYDTTSGRIFDGFLILDAPFVGNQQIFAPNLGFLSAPMMFVAGEVDRTFRFIPVQIGEIVNNSNLNARALSRFYTVRNVPVLYTDFTLSFMRPSMGLGPDPEFFRGGGEQLRPLTAALLDDLAKWGMQGVPPPTAVFNGEVKTGPDRIEFYRTSPPVTALPYVDDLSLDVSLFGSLTTPNANMRARWTVTRNALGATIGSIVLPETACRRGGLKFNDIDGVNDTAFKPFDEATFLARWGSQSSYQSCRVQLTDAMEAAGFYDPNFVTIDVDPDHFPNVIDLGSKERLRVAIFSTANFDATDVIPGTVRLASVRAQGVEKNPGNIVANVVDVNQDGRPDLVVEFRRDRLLLNPGEIVVDFWGSTKRGGVIMGSDIVEIVE